MTEEQVTWQELATLCETLDLTPGHNSEHGRTWARLDDGTVVWAPTEGVHFGARHPSLEVPGTWRLQGARIRQWGADLEREQAEREAAMTPDQLAAHRKEQQRMANMPDPPDWKMDEVLDRTGRGLYR